MTIEPGPWGSEPPPPRRVARARVARAPRRLWILAAVLAVALAIVAALSVYFPDRLSTPQDWGFLAQMLAILALVASGLVLTWRLGARHIARSVAVWACVMGAVLLGAIYWSDISAMALRVRGALIPAYAVPAAGGHSLSVSEDAQGSYHVIGLVNGQRVDFLIDTGASDVVLSPTDAKRLGIDLDTLKFTKPYETANGIGEGAAWTADSLAIGPLRVTNVPVSINKTPMSTSLLGMSFLKRLDSFEFRNGQLILKW
jgi:aspartyl protease family protein